MHLYGEWKSIYFGSGRKTHQNIHSPVPAVAYGTAWLVQLE
jgi:hypothetical protein